MSSVVSTTGIDSLEQIVSALTIRLLSCVSRGTLNSTHSLNNSLTLPLTSHAVATTTCEVNFNVAKYF